MTDPFINDPVGHDACRCLQDEQALALTIDPANMTMPTCECQCKKCQKYRALYAGIVRRAKLELRLAKADIDIGDLADIMWHRFFADGLEVWLKKRLAEALRELLGKLRLKSWIAVTEESIRGLGEDAQHGPTETRKRT